jgi:hypothetical protein
MWGVLLALLATVASGECVAINATRDAGICARYVAPYQDSVYQTSATLQGGFNTILQQYCDLFVAEFNYRKYYWAFSCALAFPMCDPTTGQALLLCPSGPSGCDTRLPGTICQSQVPLAFAGQPCTPLGDPFFVPLSAGRALPPVLLLLVLLLALAM